MAGSFGTVLAVRSQPQTTPKPSEVLDPKRKHYLLPHAYYRMDAYGFTVRPQHIHTYREYANIYKEEEEERLKKWKIFLKQQAEPTSAHSCSEDNTKPVVSEVTKQPRDIAQADSGGRDDSTEQRCGDSEVIEKEIELVQSVSAEGDDSTEQRCGDSEVVEKETEPVRSVRTEGDDSAEQRCGDSKVVEKDSEAVQSVSAEGDDSAEQSCGYSKVIEKETEPVRSVSAEGDGSIEKRPVSDTQGEKVPPKEAPTDQQAKTREVKTWAKMSPSLNYVEHMMSARVKKRKKMKDEKMKRLQDDLPPIEEERFSGEEPKDENKDTFNDNGIIDDLALALALASEVDSGARDEKSREPSFPWKELEFLVQGGVPKDLRGEAWQAFVGVSTRHVERYYQDLLATESDDADAKEHGEVLSGDNMQQNEGKRYDLPEKLKKQIEKDLPRTFPGHPALNDKGRNSLRRVLLAYARHNPSVGYCQAMNFFAGLLLLMMPEENAFWTLVGIIDDHFEGYFSQEMIESQVDQLVFEDLMRERFPKLVNHLDFLGVEVAWISGPWFLSIFVNMLPWESVLRVWDVLLFEGNRVMLFRTALALMDLYGPAIVTTKDAGDAITLFQTLAGSTFDSSQLVLTACMGFLTITEDRLDELREKHRPAVLAAVEERAKGSRVFKDPKGLATKLYSFKHDPESIIKESKTEAGSGERINVYGMSDLDSYPAKLDEILNGITIDSEVGSLPDLQEQVVWLKVELCRLLEEKRSAMLRAEELEAALMEMVKEDNRRELTARVEQLEQEVSELRQALADKKVGEQAMLQVLMKVEQEQKVTEDGRRSAEQDAAAQRYAVRVLEEKYEKAMNSLAQMEKRAVMAESLLQATLEYESGQSKALASPRPGHAECRQEAPTKKTGLLSFGLGWRDRIKGKSSGDVAPADSKPKNDGSDKSNTEADTSGQQK